MSGIYRVAKSVTPYVKVKIIEIRYREIFYSGNRDFKTTGLPDLHTREKLFSEITKHHTTDTAAKSAALYKTPEIKWGGVW